MTTGLQSVGTSKQRFPASLLSTHTSRVNMIREWARHDANTYRAFHATLEQYGKSMKDSSILDVGCGLNAPMTLMLHSAGARVTGIDDQVGYRWGLGFRPARYAAYYREAGLSKAVRKAAGELVYDRRYYAALAECLGFSLSDRALDVRVMSADALRLPDATYDIVHSNATWEHLADPASVNREVARILRPGGIAYIEIHLFPSLSGGHDLPWIVPGRTELGPVKPWRHLRDGDWQQPVRLNRLRERDFLHLFEQTPGLQLSECRTEFTEGEEYLTDDIRAELRDYSAGELTKRSIIAILRKQA